MGEGPASVPALFSLDAISLGNSDSSCPASYRASTSLLPNKLKDVDGRDKPGHDDRCGLARAQRIHFSFGMIALMVATSAGGVW
jgi:hypothetical protein